MDEVVVDDRGRILIPKEMRDRLGLRKGNRAKVEVLDGKLILMPLVSAARFIEEMEGCIREGEPATDPMRLKEMWEPAIGNRKDVR